MPGKHNAGGCGCCGTNDACTNCPRFESVSISGSVAVVRTCSGSSPAIDGTYAESLFAPVSSSFPCALLHTVYSTACSPGGPPVTEQVSIGITFTLISGGFSVSVFVNYTGNLVTPAEYHEYKKNFTSGCPSGTISIPFLASQLSGVGSTAPTAVDMTWP